MIDPNKTAVLNHQPCPFGCGSSDAATKYADGHWHCFSCSETTPKKRSKPIDNRTYTKEYLPWRGITADVFQKYGALTSIDAEGKPHHVSFPYPEGGLKHREINTKSFWAEGPMNHPGFFGQQLFPPGCARSITLTEGELDAMSVYQAVGYPAVSLRASSSARKHCAANFDYLNSFEKIYLALDDDEVGRKAAQEIASLFDFNKVYHVKFGNLKDANEYLQQDRMRELRSVWWNAKKYMPEGVVSSPEEFASILRDEETKPAVPFPWENLQSVVKGIRTGEFILITAPEGVGKTEFIRRIEHHLLTTTESPIGCIHLEETKARQLKGLAGLDMEVPAHLPESGVSSEDILEALARITKGRDDRLHIYSHFGSEDPDVLLETIRFLVVVCGCKYIFLDHITMIVSGLETDDERRTLDYLSTKLATMCHDLDFALFCISHVNDDGQTRGSRNISKVANTRIDLRRNTMADLEEDRNKTFLTVPKNRFASTTGPAGVLYFDPEAFMLRDQPVTILPPVD